MNGEILYKGKKLSGKARTKLFGMVMQEVNHQLFSDSAKNECLLANEEASEQKIRELLEKFDLEEYAEYHPMILSGGQRQRLANVCRCTRMIHFIRQNSPQTGDMRRALI